MLAKLISWFRKSSREKGAEIPDEQRGDLVALVPVRLGWPGKLEEGPALIKDDAHQDLRRQGLEWQQISTKAEMWEMGATSRGAEEGRAFQLAGQMASVGEQLGLASAAALEAALWQDARTEEMVQDRVVREMSMRASAEAQSLFVMGAGHSLGNVGVYALAFDGALLAELIKEFGRGATFKPFSSAKEDWVSLSGWTAHRLRSVASTATASSIPRFVEPITDLAESKEWTALVERRGEDFHRWRPQSHGLMGVPKRTPWRRDKMGTRSLAFGGPRQYKDAEELAHDTARIATEAMHALSKAMGDVMERWPDASADLGGPEFRQS